jgi:hypothetical protein
MVMQDLIPHSSEYIPFNHKVSLVTSAIVIYSASLVAKLLLEIVGLCFARQLGRLLQNLDHKLNILQLQAASWYLKETKKK